LRLIKLGVVDPAPIASQWVAVIKGLGFVLAILALAASLRRLPADDDAKLGRYENGE
jgi:hypothetical protein